VRVVAVDKESTAKISDWLWLPTLWEMTGNNKASIWATYEVNQETSENQASLAYYSGRKNPNRIKYDIYIGVIRRNYWLASPYPHSDVQFCTVNSYDRYGSPGFLEARQVAGVAPAFCVQ
jgi:hypothetical protein